MSWQKWMADRLFVLEQTVHQALRKAPQHIQIEILHAVRTTCEGNAGQSAIIEHLVEWAEDDDEGLNFGPVSERFVRYAREMHRIYGDRKNSE